LQTLQTASLLLSAQAEAAYYSGKLIFHSAEFIGI